MGHFNRAWQILDAGGYGGSYVGDILGGWWEEPLWEIARRTSQRSWSVISEVPETIAPDETPSTWEELEELIPEIFEPILETRPGRVPDPYPQDVSDDIVPEDDEVAHTWGHIAREFLGGIINPADPTLYPSPDFLAPGPGIGVPSAAAVASGAGCDGMAWSGGVPPKGYKVVNHCGVGVLRKIRRRRRRRMLTASDASDLATIVGIVGKGQMASSMINRTRS